MEINKLSIKEIVEAVKAKQLTASEILDYYIKQVDKYKSYNAIIEVFEDAKEKAQQIDKKIANNQNVGALAGIPVVIKDNILCKGKHASCASAFLKDFVAPYSSTIVKKLEAEDAIIFARANMDEFAMGGSCEKSIYGATFNAHDLTRVAGGSSGGSAVAVALGLCPVAIGTDTGGSIRQPSSFNGVVGIKPTYGTISRYGIVAFASSTDQAGPITRSIEDNEFVLKILSGKDLNDQTSICSDLGESLLNKKFTVGICKELKDKIESLSQYPNYKEALNKLHNNGVEIKEVSVPHIANSLACYYILTPAEATSNLARFDGVKYTTRAQNSDTIEEIYINSRSQGFGEEVQRRIMLGNYVLSSGYFDAYYKKAKRLQILLKREFASAFEDCDAIITPTTPDIAFKVGEKSNDPVSMYLEDLFTVPASIAGVPAISVPYAIGKDNMPLGIQLIGKEKSEKVLYALAKILSKEDK